MQSAKVQAWMLALVLLQKATSAAQQQAGTNLCDVERAKQLPERPGRRIALAP